MVYREYLIFTYELGIISTIKSQGHWEETAPGPSSSQNYTGPLLQRT